MATDLLVFQPNDGQTKNISFSASASSANVALPSRSSNGNETIRVFNGLSVTAFIKFGTSSSLAATTSADVPIPSGQTEAFACPPDYTYVAAIPASSASGNVYFSIGKGS